MSARARRRRSEARTVDANAVLRIVAIGLVAFFVGYAGAAILFFGGIRGDDIVTVPDLRWRPEDEARRMLQRADLEFELGSALVNPQVPEGHVLAQSPLPGSEVSPGSRVRVTLSSGAERRPVPDVRAFGGEQARHLLTQSGFEVVVEERADALPEGRVIEISPVPGTTVQMPATVRLVVSAGPPWEPVPNVLGMLEGQARETLEGAGFHVGELRYNPFSLSETGTVLEQAPVAGDSLRVGSAVSITVAGVDPWDL